jgi:hypothetical protein
MARARKKAVALDDPEERIFKPVDDAVTAFLGHCASEGLTDSTISKYRNALGKLTRFCKDRDIDSLAELTTEKLDSFRAGRVLNRSRHRRNWKSCGCFLASAWIAAGCGTTRRSVSSRHATSNRMKWCLSPSNRSRTY